jgi:hypothetical protein
LQCHWHEPDRLLHAELQLGRRALSCRGPEQLALEIRGIARQQSFERHILTMIEWDETISKKLMTLAIAPASGMAKDGDAGSTRVICSIAVGWSPCPQLAVHIARARRYWRS